MRRFKGSKAIALLAAAGVMVFMVVQAIAANVPQATVSFLEGSATAKVGATGDWETLKKGSKLTAKHVVKTAAKSRLEMQLPDGSVLRVAPKSRVRLKSILGSKTKTDDKSTFKVMGGKIWANVSKAVGSERKFEVVTDNAVAGVRGTIFRVDTDSDATVVRVYSGSVAVSNAPLGAMMKGNKPAKKGERKQVPGPRQVSKKEFEELVAKAMQQIKVSADGKLAMSSFDKEADAADKWVKWNEERDKLALVPIPE